jgi:hypothetical protein
MTWHTAITRVQRHKKRQANISIHSVAKGQTQQYALVTQTAVHNIQGLATSFQVYLPMPNPQTSSLLAWAVLAACTTISPCICPGRGQGEGQCFSVGSSTQLVERICCGDTNLGILGAAGLHIQASLWGSLGWFIWGATHKPLETGWRAHACFQCNLNLALIRPTHLCFSPADGACGLLQPPIFVPQFLLRMPANQHVNRQ